MGVRLVRYNRPISGNTDSNTAQNFDHDELINRDLLNQHPIYAITGLQEALNLLEDNIYNLSLLIEHKDSEVNAKITKILLDLDALEKRVTNAENRIKKLESMKYIDTSSVIFKYDPTTPSLRANVRIWKPDNEDDENTNILKNLGGGLYVPSVNYKDSTTIEWKAEIIGETLKEIFDNGIVFSHAGSWTKIYSAADASGWYWDNSLQSIVQPRNSDTYTGFVTKNIYDYYEHTCQIKSTDADDDWNGIVIGYMEDENGNPHTLSAIVDRGGWSPNGGGLFALWYDFNLPDAQRLGYKSMGGTGGWSSIPNGVTIRVEKHGNLISAVCSRWNSTTLDESMRLNIDLDNYSWGSLFSEEVHYGYSTWSQGYSFYQNIQFTCSQAITRTDVGAMVKLSNDSTNGLSVKSDGLYSEKFRVSANAFNGLIKKNDGYWVQQTKVSTKANNALQLLSDGTLYARDYRNIRLVTQANHGFVVGDIIYYHPTSAYQKAKALDDYDVNIVGMVTAVLSTSQFEYQWEGFFQTTLFTSANGFIQGMPVYISEDTPGKVVQEQPDVSKTVGYPVENAGIVIAIERGIQYNQEASIGDFKSSANTYNVRSDGFIRVIEGVDYKRTLIHRLIETMTPEFKASYMIFDDANGLVRFKNTSQLYADNNVKNGLNLFIKAF